MAADTTGNKSLDLIRTNQLTTEVINFIKTTQISRGISIKDIYGRGFCGGKKFSKINI